MQLTNAIVAALAACATTVAAAPSARASYTAPSVSKIHSVANWAWGPSEKPKEADMVMLDGDLESESTIKSLISKGKYVSCYMSAGTVENFRSDASKFSDDTSKKYKGFGGTETWLDITNWQSFKGPMEDRVKAYAAKGCMGIEADNVDCYNNGCVAGKSADELLKDEIAYVSWLFDTIHAHGMAAGLKNAQEVGKALMSKVDYLVNEQCVQYGECGLYKPAVDAKKVVYNVEYEGGQSACNKAKSMGLLSQVKTGSSWINCF